MFNTKESVNNKFLISYPSLKISNKYYLCGKESGVTSIFCNENFFTKKKPFAKLFEGVNQNPIGEFDKKKGSNI